MGKLRQHSGLGRFPRTPLVVKECWRCGSRWHTSLDCREAPRKPIPAKRATERRSSRTTDEAYKAFLRNDVCGVALVLGHDRDCWGPIDPEHERQGVGMGQTASDDRAWGCCRKHHDERHDGNGHFKHWPQEQLRSFIQQRITVSRTRYAHFLATGEAPHV